MKLDNRMSIVIILLYLVASFYLFYMGSDGPGALYLLAISFFSATVLPARVVYLPVFINTFVCLIIGSIIWVEPLSTPLSESYDLSLWLVYSGNLIFVSFISVLLIHSVLNGFEKTIIKEASLLKKLDSSERYYRNIFDSNPVPMYIFALKTGNFLKVNEATIRKYGYTQDEFLKMNITDIRPSDEIGKLMDIFSKIKTRPYSGLLTHLNKNGETFPVEVDTNIVHLDGIESRLVLATDVSDRVNYVRMIEKQNQDLKDIAWIQSHKVRAPLSNIMGLTEIMLQEPHGDHEQILYMLKKATNELNDAIQAIVRQAEQAGIQSA